MRKRKGFTLIELLVVVAIIGILSTVVVVSVSGAQSKAKDAKIKSDLAQISKAAERYAITSGNYYQNLNCTNSTACEAFSSDPNPDKKAIGELALDIKSVNSEGLVLTAYNKSYLAQTHLFSTSSGPKETISNIAGVELLSNSGFESTGTGIDLWTAWSETYNDSGANASLRDTTVSSELKNGAHGAKIIGPSTNYPHIDQTIALTQGKYALSFWVKGSKALYYVKDNTNNNVIFNYSSVGAKDDAYSLFTITFDSAAAGNSQFQISVGSTAPPGPASYVYFDDVSVKQF